MKTAPGVDRRTRDRVVRVLLELGPVTASTLGERLGLTPAAVRRHLDALVADGTVAVRAPRVSAGARGRGRPARVFALSDAGHAGLDTRYDDLAAAALRFLGETGGAGAVASFARARVAELEQRYGPQVADRPGTARVQALAEVLSADGYAATIAPGPVAPGTGVQICQHHCPVQHVAAQFPELCDAETEAFARLLGTHVQRLATIASGDGVCTTHVPLPAPADAVPAEAGRSDGAPSTTAPSTTAPSSTAPSSTAPSTTSLSGRTAL